VEEDSGSELLSFSRGYLAALERYVGQAHKSRAKSADRLGRKALAMGLETLDLARIHEKALIDLVPLNCCSPRRRDTLITQAETFFMEVLTPIETTHFAAMDAKAALERANQTLEQRAVEMDASNGQLKREVARGAAMAVALKKSKEHYRQLLEQSHQMQDRLQKLSHLVLSAQEDERKRISRELHDEIAQALTGVHVHLAALEAEATVNTKDLKKRIAETQRLVEESVESVHQFALELRPSLLDDLGLIPAIRSHVKEFKLRTGIRVHFTVRGSTGIEQLDSLKRTVLYRIVQEALTNVAKHAESSLVEMRMRRLKGAICLEIRDNGKSFDEKRICSDKKNRGLGLVVMRERLEMVGGSFAIEAIPGEGTTIRAKVPFRNGAKV